jgi:hypothetical protein
MKINNYEDWGKLLAIWVKSCNDEQPIMFYRSCKEHFGFKSEQEVRVLIKQNRELFRPLSDSSLKLIKKYYKDYPGIFEKTVLYKEEEDNNVTIDKLRTDSGFTSQYRIPPDKSISSPETRQFGTDLIINKWKLTVKSREERFRSWAYIIVPIIALVGSILLSLFAILHVK